MSLPAAVRPAARPAVAPPRRVLVVCLRRIGDVLLATALIRSLKTAWPQAQIEALVFAETAAVLAGNPDLARVMALPARGPEWRRTLLPLFRAYDLAIATQTSDRAHGVARWCGRRTAGLLPPSNEPSRTWKRLLIGRTATPEAAQHAVVRYLALADALGIPRVPVLVPPRPAMLDRLDAALGSGWDARRYAVVHPMAMFRYKGWTQAGWRALIAGLRARDLRVCVTGGPAAAERAFVAELLSPFAADADVIDLAGRLSLAELTPLLEAAQVFIGPDTSVTHLAAACGTPTVALFGPSDPVVWGPWPQGCASDAASPWQRTAARQSLGNVTLLQGTAGRYPDCIPCLQEGCERRLDSGSDCLDALPPARVLAAVHAHG